MYLNNTLFTDYSDRPINYFLLKALEEKLNPNNLKQLFGEKYDILTLLDYWNIAVEENIDFFEEFRYLQCFNKHDLNIIIDKNYKYEKWKFMYRMLL